MVAGYTRQAAANIQPGLRCNAEDVNAEYNQLANAFDNTNGHDQSGSVAGDAARIPLASAVSGVLPVANGGTGTSSGSGGPFLPLTGGALTGGLNANGGLTVQGGAQVSTGNLQVSTGNLTVSGAATVNGGLTVNPNLVVSGGASIGTGLTAATVTANVGSGTAFYAPNGNLVLGGGITVTGNLGGNLSIHATNAIEADFFGNAFYAPNGGFDGLTATLAGTGSAVLNCFNGACSATAFNVVSDAGLKRDVSDHEFGLAHILALAPKSFRYVAAPEREVAGLIAQDVAGVLPHAVVEVAVPARGEAVPESGESVLAIDYAAVVVSLVNAVKGLAAQVEVLQARLGG